MIDPDILIHTLVHDHDPLFLCNPAGTLLYMNNSFADILGFQKDDLYGVSIEHILADGSSETVLAAAGDGQRWQGTVRCLRKDNSEISVSTTIRAVHGREDTVIALLGSFRNTVTGDSGPEATTPVLNGGNGIDYLTRLPDRHVTGDELDRELSRAQRHGRPLAILLADIDRFRIINDDMGYETGDQVIRDVADILKATLRPSDRIGRWSGDEFVVILPETERTGAVTAAERIRAAVEAAQLLPDRIVTVSVGITAMAPIDSTKAGGLAHSRESLLRVADEELLRGKESGGNCISG